MKKALALVFILIATIQCSEDPLNKNVDFAIAPKNPIVIDADYTYTRTVGDEVREITVGGPWFQFSYTITNNSDRTLVLASVAYTVEATAKDGGELVSSTGNIDPGELDVDPAQTVLARVPPGGSYGFTPSEKNLATWVIHSLPDLEIVRSLAYKVKFEGIGWFEDAETGSPSKTMKKRVQVTTQF